MSDLHIPSIFLIKAHLYGNDVESVEWGPSSCEITTKSGHVFSIDRELFKEILTNPPPWPPKEETAKAESWGPWGWQKDPKTVSKQVADISEMLFNLAKIETLSEETQVQFAKAGLLCSEASYTAVGEDPAVDGLFTDVTVAIEEKADLERRVRALEEENDPVLRRAREWHEAQRNQRS